MGTNQRVKETALVFEGQKSGLPVESYGIKSGQEIKNYNLREGKLKKVNGGTIYAGVLPDASGGIVSENFFNGRLVVQRGNSVALETAEGSREFQTLTSSLFSSRPLVGQQWRNELFLTNGVDQYFIWEGTDGTIKWKTIGLFASPFFTGAQAFSTDVSQAGNLSGTFFWYLTFLDEDTNTESPAVAAFTYIDGLFNLSPNITFFPASAVGAANSISSKKAILAFSDMQTYLNLALSTMQRVPTHFIIYRGNATPSGPLSAFFDVSDVNRVTNTNSSASTLGQSVINIQQFLDDGLDFEDNTATLPAVSLLDNNSPPPNAYQNYICDLIFSNEIPEPSGGEQTFLEVLPPSEMDTNKWIGFRHIRFFRDQLFGIGSKRRGFDLSTPFYAEDQTQLTGNITKYQDLLMGSEVYQPDYWTYVWEVGRGDGQEAIGLGVLGDVALLLFKYKSTYYITGSSPDNYLVRIMDTQKGCVDEKTIQETSKGVICLDRSGFVLFNKIGEGTRLSNPDIEDVIESINFSYSYLFHSCYDQKSEIYRCAVVTGNSITPNKTICYYVDSGQFTIEEGREGASRIIDTRSDGTYVDLVGSYTTNRVVDYSSGQVGTDQGQAIEAIWTSGTMTFGDDQHQKKLQWLYIRAKANSTWTVDIEIIPDFDESRKFVITDWNVIGSQSTWYSSDLATDGSLIWSEGNWAHEGVFAMTSKIPIKSIGYTFQVRIINRDPDINHWGFSIESVSLDGSILGR